VRSQNSETTKVFTPAHCTETNKGLRGVNKREECGGEEGRKKKAGKKKGNMA